MVLDGCKIVERRLLYGLYEKAKDHFTKSAEVVGHVIGNMHPHGDCVKGNTKIYLLNGTSPTIKELAEENKPFWVYSCDNKGNIVPGYAHSARIGQSTKIMYKITLDNNEIIECTSNHPFMLKDCTYVNADSLQIGMSLMPFHQSIVNNYMMCSNGTYGANYKYKYSGNNFIETKKISYISEHGKISKNMIIHHKDFNKLNDNPDNLVMLSRKDHAKIHMENDHNFKISASNALLKGRIEMFSENGKFRNKTREKNSKLINSVNKKLPLIKAIKIIQYMTKNNIELVQCEYDKIRKDFGYNYPYINILIKNEYINSFEDLVEKSKLYNHKVIKVEKIILEKEENFYDITVDKYHNFAIGQGIFVHNSSTYQSLVSLVQGGLATGQGNWGIEVGIDDCPPAAQRYTEVKASKDVLDLAFEYIKYVKQEPLELKDEPIFLPTKLPICLINKNYCQGIGFGSRTVMPSYEVKDLVKRLRWLLKYDKEEPVIKPRTDCTLLSSDDELKKILTTGIGKLEYRGITQVDKTNKCVIVKSVPPSRNLKKILEIFRKEIETDKAIGFIDESTTETKVRFTVTKRTYKIDNFIKKLNQNLLGSITFECNMCDEEGNVVLVSIDQMLLNCYNNYKQIVDTVLKLEIQQLNEKINELELIKKIKVVLPKFLKEYPDDADKVMTLVSESTQIPLETVKMIFDKYTLTKILKNKADTDQLILERNAIQENLNNLEKYIWDNKYQKLL